jgi:enoyl-CoA hydratase
MAPLNWQDFEYVHTTLSEGIALVHIDDPNDDGFVVERHPMHRELRDIFGLLDDDPDVMAIVLEGGKEEFCPQPQLAQLDALLRESPDAARQLQAEARDTVIGLLDLGKPLVASVAKPVAGFGAQLVFLSDFVVASRDVTFRDSHVRAGLTAGDGGTLIWPLMVGLGRARKHILRGHPLAADEADELGLIAELVAQPDEVHPRAMGLASKLAALPSSAYATTKQSLNGWLRVAVRDTLDVASRAQVETYGSPEFMSLRRSSRTTNTEHER